MQMGFVVPPPPEARFQPPASVGSTQDGSGVVGTEGVCGTVSARCGAGRGGRHGGRGGAVSGAGATRRLSATEIAATLAAIKERVRERHGLPPAGPDEPPGEARSALTEAMDAAHISAHTPILWDLPVVGQGIALGKRVVRLLLRWYINPIVDQQNDFNAAAVRALGELAAENERLRLALERLSAARDQAARPAG